MTLLSKVLGSFGWKCATIAAILISLALTGGLFYLHIQNNEIGRQRNELQASITDPETGYIAQLTQSRRNVVVLEEQLDRQNQLYRADAAKWANQLAETKRELAEAQRQTRAMEAQVQSFLAQKIEGDTLEERILDVDRRAVEEFLK